MRYVDDFRNADHVRALAARINENAEELDAPVRFMEVCGGHTMAIHRFGLPDLLPSSVELISGPGCPVCVTSTAYIDTAIELAERGDLIATFGDLYRVPGREKTLEATAAAGADVQVVYSPRDALTLAKEHPDRQVTFLGVGFETTVPTVAATVLEADSSGINNLRFLSGHKTMPEALRALVEAPEVALDGFLLPGHVSTITGRDIYRFLTEEFNVPCCISGFEPTDMLQAIESLVEQCVRGEAEVDNKYGRAVRPEGNQRAQGIINSVFEPVDARWRGIGPIPGSGLDLRDKWESRRVERPNPSVGSPEFGACRCGDVLRGLINPPDCPLFGKRCTPENPVGPCMVSSEGSCAAHYKYGSTR